MQIEVSLFYCPFNGLCRYPITAAQAQARIKILEKLPDLEPPETEDTESFKYILFKP